MKPWKRAVLAVVLLGMAVALVACWDPESNVPYFQGQDDREKAEDAADELQERLEKTQEELERQGEGVQKWLDGFFGD